MPEMTCPTLRCAASLLLVSSGLPAGAVPVLKAGYSLEDAGQVRTFETVAEAGSVALYESGRVRKASARRVVTPEVLVRLENPAAAAAMAAQCGASAWRAAPVLTDAVILTFPGKDGEALPAAEVLRSIKGVRSAEPLLARQQVKRWIPNDPYFAYSGTNAGYQWHLNNTGQNGGMPGIDINVSGVWDNWRGSGMRIGILDDGLQTAHPDLSPNCDTVNDYDWNGGDNDPSPGSFDTHGTCCAGVAAGRGNNGAGICGAAPEAMLVGLRLIATASTDATESAAFLHRSDIIQVKSNSWGPDDTGDVIEGPGTLAAAALADAAANGRGGRGTITFWAGGNGLGRGDDSNFDGYANSIYVIATGALSNSGTQANYSESGANLLIVAPSDGGSQGISTSDVTGSAGYNSGGGGNFASADYTNDFGGTSSASPLAAGVAALLLQSNPNLGWRDVKEILIRSATQIHAGDAGWFTNAAGFHFNDKYGAGLINAGAAAALATGWSNLGPLISQTMSADGGVAIPDSSTAGAVKTFTFTAAQETRVEQLALSVNITHARRGQLQVELTSPSGTLCKLARPRPDNGAGLVWTFTTPQFWGETPQGVWTLRVKDTVNGNSGTLNSAGLTLYGTGTSGAPSITSGGSGSGQTGRSFSFQATAANTPGEWTAVPLPPGLDIGTASGLITGTPTAAGVYPVTLTATNAAGSGSATLTITITAPPPGMAKALDAPALAFTVSGVPWFSEVTTTHDGMDAAQSGVISDNGTSVIETTVAVSGPVVVSFWWQVSSELNFDFLRFSVDGAEVRAISGTVNWTRAGHLLSAGSHTLRWSYEKDSSGAGGLDAAWLDSISVQSAIVPLTAAGLGTGFQEPALDATFHLRTAGEIGWTANSGKVTEAGNRNPPLTGAATGGTPGVKSFEINNNSGSVTLRTDIVDLAGFDNVSAEADVRTYTTSLTNFEIPDTLVISTELSADAVTWSPGPDILPRRTGGTGVEDTLIPLNTAENSVYNHFTAVPGAIPAHTRYLRVAVTGITDGPGEYLVIDNLRITGTALTADADGDGFTAADEAWFGTSDASAASTPAPVLTSPAGAARVTFPSVAGNTYLIESSGDLINWTTATVTATAATTSWDDPAGASPQRQYYKVGKP